MLGRDIDVFVLFSRLIRGRLRIQNQFRAMLLAVNHCFARCFMFYCAASVAFPRFFCAISLSRAMAPKGKGKAKAKAKTLALPPIDGGASVSAGSAADAPDSTVPHPANVEYLDKLAQAWLTVTSHPVFTNVVNESPLEIEARVVNLCC